MKYVERSSPQIYSPPTAVPIHVVCGTHFVKRKIRQKQKRKCRQQYTQLMFRCCLTGFTEEETERTIVKINSEVRSGPLPT